MKVSYSKRFSKSLENAPGPIQKAFYKQVRFLQQDLGYPSLRSKKYDEANDIWQARVNDDWRFYFSIIGDTYQLHDIIPHPR
jgi:mRNA-degrading endonuclease RelE of RelBE toxin-antitoxin system